MLLVLFSVQCEGLIHSKVMTLTRPVYLPGHLPDEDFPVCHPRGQIQLLPSGI